MMTPEALADTDRKVEVAEVERDVYIVAELIDYLRWLANQDTGIVLTSGAVWMLYHEGVRKGRVWSEVCEDIGLPVREEW